MEQSSQEGEVPKGFLLIGLSNTFLFSGESAHELLFLNLSTGDDFAMPVTEEQAAVVISFAASSLAEEEPQDGVISPDVFKGAEEASQL